MGKWIGIGALILGILLLLIIAPIALAAALMGGGNEEECVSDAGGGGADGPVYLVGDSLGVGIKDKLPARFTVNAEGGRSLPAGIDIVRGAPQALKDASAVVVELGTNKSSGFAGDAEDMVEEIKKENGSATIYWVKIFATANDYSAENNAIDGLTDVTPIKTQGEGINLGGDGVHPTPAGYDTMAQVVSDAVDAGGNGGGGPECPEEEGGTVSGNVQELAQKILQRIESGKIVQDYKSSTGDTIEQLERAASGRKFQMTCTSHGGPKDVDVNPAILKFLIEASDETKVGLSNITDKCHTSPGSNHYTGEAVDLTCTTQDISAVERVVSKYGGSNNGEVCPGNGHWHYDFPKGG
ncbi:MAG: hypothetical protein M3N59_00325 [bacterium]|nr:hypothetical protein [bacterium]